jgi:hypothetical protein
LKGYVGKDTPSLAPSPATTGTTRNTEVPPKRADATSNPKPSK